MFDPDNPDRPPLPPDDPTSQKFDAVRRRHARLAALAPRRRYAVRGKSLLDEVSGVQRRRRVGSRPLRGRSNCPAGFAEYQRALEELYLSALDVTFQRFRFDAQFFGSNSNFLHGRRAAAPRRQRRPQPPAGRRELAPGSQAFGHRRRTDRGRRQFADVAVRRPRPKQLHLVVEFLDNATAVASGRSGRGDGEPYPSRTHAPGGRPPNGIFSPRLLRADRLGRSLPPSPVRTELDLDTLQPNLFGSVGGSFR